MHWLSQNYKWLFDGAGGAAVITVIGYLIHRLLRSSTQGSAVLTIQSTNLGGVAYQDVTGFQGSRLLKTQQGPARHAWPEKLGEYIATTSDAIPLFPQSLSGFRSTGENRDFWDKPFRTRGCVRLFEGHDWEGIPDFPRTMNGCSHGVFMIRWRSAHPYLSVRSSVRRSSQSCGDEKTGAFGCMFGTNCEQPMFKFGEGRYGATLVDLFYELKFWQAAP